MSRKEEAHRLSEMFNQRGFNTCALTGEATEKQRQEAMDSLESNKDGSLDYIFTVDIFNEGIDIPKVNQVVMLRPTQSSIIFIQQLGRGLRKTMKKIMLLLLISLVIMKRTSLFQLLWVEIQILIKII